MRAKNTSSLRPMDFLLNDIVDVNENDTSRELTVMRQYDSGVVIVKINSLVGLISEISITCVEKYAGHTFSRSGSFRFPTTADLLKFAKHVDSTLLDDLTPLAPLGDEVQDTVLARAIMRSFEAPNMLVMGKDAPTPETMLQAMKPMFSSLNEFVDYLKKHGIAYHT